MTEHVVPKTKTKTVTVQGIEVTVNPRVFDDWETMELLSLTSPDDGSNPSGTAGLKLFRRVLGSQCDKVQKALGERDEDGFVPIEVLNSFMQELMDKVAPNS